jgi:protein-S-isoprenylcysteine O-methyltransferase Ste14
MNEFRSRPLNFPWPPFIYLAASLLAYMLNIQHQLLLFPHAGIAAKAAGGTLIAIAVGLDLWATATLWDRRTTVMPNRCASHLVTCGPFRYTRNPIYLGYTLITVGLGLMLGNAWFGIMAIMAAAATTFLAIRREEFHLLSRFGFEFERYCRTTRRWV